MVASFASKVAVATLALFSCLAVCAERLPPGGPGDLARARLMAATAQLGDAMAACSATGMAIGIPRSEALGVRKEALLLGVGYFHTKRYNECIAPAAKEFLFAAKVLQAGGAEGGSEQNIKGDAFELVDVVLSGWWRELEFESRYREQVSAPERTKIEAITGLGKPFDMILSWKRSGNGETQ